MYKFGYGIVVVLKFEVFLYINSYYYFVYWDIVSLVYFVDNYYGIF